MIIYTVTTNDKNELIKLKLEQQIENLDSSYKVSTNRFKLLSDNLYTLIINQPETIELFYKAKHSKIEAQRAAIREKLYKRMKPYYEQLTKSGVNIILFAFEDNKTFLRVHKPSKYDDDLSSVRYSFTYVNDQKKSIRGFEQGKVSHAFRNIFPLYHNDEYVGSVDIAFSSEVLQENMTLLHGIDTHFILNKTLFDVNVYKAQKKVKYIQSVENEDFLFSLTPSLSDNAFAPEKLELNGALKYEIAKNIRHNGPFAIHKNNGSVQIIAFSPIKNIKDRKTVAYLVSYTDSYHLERMLNRYLWINIIFLISLLLLAAAIANNVKQRFYLQTRVDEEVEKNKKQQQTMFEQSRLAQMGEMISMIAHQWRQPLGAISSTSLDLQMQLEFNNFDLQNKKESENCQTYFNDSLKNIDKLVQNLTITIDDFRNFYKPNKELVLISFEDVCKKALLIIKASLVSDGIEVICEHESNQEIEIFDNEMMHVILNILKNAHDNFKDKKIVKPKIEVITTKNSITICDNGGGIPEDILEKIFDPYFSTKGEKNGTGLGLYMSKIIVQEHHSGTLSAQNTGDGVCFKIELEEI